MSRGTRRRRAGTVAGIGAVAVCLTGAGCVSYRVPQGYLPPPEAAERESMGGWIELTRQGDGGTVERAGELIAVSGDTLWVLSSTRLWAVPTSSVIDGTVVGYDSRAQRLITLALLGTVSTISNGVFLVFTAPGWAIAGTVATNSQTRLPTIPLPVAEWGALAVFARFPQGMPEGLDRAELVRIR